MGIEHSKGTQKLCYINAEHEEECFRNTFDDLDRLLEGGTFNNFRNNTPDW